MRKTIFVFLLWIAASCQTVGVQDPSPVHKFIGTLLPDEEILKIDTRPGVTVRVLITKPQRPPQGVVLIYPGGEGFLIGANGLAYGAFRREFSTLGYLSAVVDTPSDYPKGLGGRGETYEYFRVDERHALDARAVIAALSHHGPLPVYLFGHSMGAISVAHLAATLKDQNLRGVILAGSPTKRGSMGTGMTVTNAHLGKIEVPAVIVHHRDDGCVGSTFQGASEYPRYFKSSPRVGFIRVIGGDSPSPNPCVGNNFHSFYGKRREVVETVIRWMNGESIDQVGG